MSHYQAPSFCDCTWHLGSLLLATFSLKVKRPGEETHTVGQWTLNHASRNGTEWTHTYIETAGKPSPQSLPSQMEQLLYLTKIWAFSALFERELTFPTTAARGPLPLGYEQSFKQTRCLFYGTTEDVSQQRYARGSSTPTGAVVSVKFLSAQAGKFWNRKFWKYQWFLLDMVCILPNASCLQQNSVATCTPLPPLELPVSHQP